MLHQQDIFIQICINLLGFYFLNMMVYIFFVNKNGNSSHNYIYYILIHFLIIFLDYVLKYNEDDGQLVEPEYYLPIIPTVLINGADGIGTGWSTSIP